METEASFSAPPGSVWRTEPFRIFFPLGVVLGWVGVGSWLLYSTGLSPSYSCIRHGLLQMQTFMMAFALGFLLTALPRRTSAPAASRGELGFGVLCLVLTTAALVDDRWILAQVGYLGLLLLLVQFGVRRFLSGAARRRPPAAFVLIPMAVLQGAVGAVVLIVYFARGLPTWSALLAQLLIEQGVFLALVIGIGSLVLPLMSGEPPPADLGSSPRETRRAVAYIAAGLLLVGSLVAEARGADSAGPLLRAVVVAIALGLTARPWRPPGKPGLHRRLALAASWCLPAGLAASAIWPDYRVPALHVAFIGGFGLLTFAVATHVALSHLDLVEAATGHPPAIVAVAVGLVLAMAARVAADGSESYFVHLGWAAGAWILGSAIWLGYVGPKVLRHAPREH